MVSLGLCSVSGSLRLLPGGHICQLDQGREFLPRGFPSGSCRIAQILDPVRKLPGLLSVTLRVGFGLDARMICACTVCTTGQHLCIHLVDGTCDAIWASGLKALYKITCLRSRGHVMWQPPWMPASSQASKSSWAFCCGGREGDLRTHACLCTASHAGIPPTGAGRPQGQEACTHRANADCHRPATIADCRAFFGREWTRGLFAPDSYRGGTRLGPLL